MAGAFLIRLPPLSCCTAPGVPTPSNTALHGGKEMMSRELLGNPGKHLSIYSQYIGQGDLSITPCQEIGLYGINWTLNAREALLLPLTHVLIVLAVV